MTLLSQHNKNKALGPVAIANVHINRAINQVNNARILADELGVDDRSRQRITQASNDLYAALLALNNYKEELY